MIGSDVRPSGVVFATELPLFTVDIPRITPSHTSKNAGNFILETAGRMLFLPSVLIVASVFLIVPPSFLLAAGGFLRVLPSFLLVAGGFLLMAPGFLPLFGSYRLVFLALVSTGNLRNARLLPLFAKNLAVIHQAFSEGGLWS